MRRAVVALSVVVLASLATGPARAADESPVRVELTALKVELDPHGNESLVEVSDVVPGDVVEYRAVYANRTDREVRGLKGTLPVPAGMAFLDETQDPARLEVSLDGRRYEAPPLYREIELPGGRIERREVAPDEYRYLRWDLDPLKPGAEVTVRARMQVRDK